MPLTIASSENGMKATLVGEFTINTVGALLDDLFGLLNLPEVDLDLTQITDFDGNALQLIKVLMTEAGRKHSKLHLAPANAKVQEGMALLGFDQPDPALTNERHGP